MPTLKKLTAPEIRAIAETIKRTYSPSAFFTKELGDLRGGLWRGGVDCPFCDGKRDKFHINSDDGGWNCSKCKAAGSDIISFTRQRYGLKFFEAVEKITGGKVIQPDPEIAQKRGAELLEARRKHIEGQAAAAVKAREIWDRATPITERSQHHYLMKKRVQAHGARLLGCVLIIPLVDADGRISTVQRIYPDGQKRLLSGGKKSGCYFILGKPTDTILIAEGFATAASLFEHTEKYAVMTGDAGNLLPVSKIIRAKHPGANIIICGDNDASGVGQAAAREAALACGGKFIFPPIEGQDFNDFINAGGLVYG
ncbi:MAG: toprim domain-containing protein [Methyloglobulus sp.]|nr:hypothetical protein [Methyloglobulus sp.]